MPAVTVSSKNQITLPVEVVRALGIQAGQKLVLDLVDGRIVAVPEPASWADYMLGAGKGTYGASAPAVDRYVAEERAAWHTGQAELDLEDFLDYFAASQGTDTGRVIGALAEVAPQDALTVGEIAGRVQPALTVEQVRRVLAEDLEARGWVRNVSKAGQEARYRLPRLLADAIAPR